MNEKKRLRRRRRVRRWLRSVMNVLMAVVVLAAAAIIVMYFVSDKNQPNAAETNQRPQLVVDPNAGDKVAATPAPAEPGVAIPGWSKMTVRAGLTEVQTSLPNPMENDGLYYLTYELRLKDTDEVLFTTGLIPPGKYCNAVTLSRALEPGEYAAIIRVQPYRMSDQSPTNNAELATLLVVE